MYTDLDFQIVWKENQILKEKINGTAEKKALFTQQDVDNYLDNEELKKEYKKNKLWVNIIHAFSFFSGLMAVVVITIFESTLNLGLLFSLLLAFFKLGFLTLWLLAYFIFDTVSKTYLKNLQEKIIK